jgi:hypothetical protein
MMLSRLVIDTSRTVGSAKKFVRITSVTIFVMFFVGRLILRELHFIYKNKLYMFLIVKAFATQDKHTGKYNAECMRFKQ